MTLGNTIYLLSMIVIFSYCCSSYCKNENFYILALFLVPITIFTEIIDGEIISNTRIIVSSLFTFVLNILGGYKMWPRFKNQKLLVIIFISVFILTGIVFATLEIRSINIMATIIEASLTGLFVGIVHSLHKSEIKES